MSSYPFELLDHNRPVLIFGCDGQVGKALKVCTSDFMVPVVHLGRSDCDLSSESSIAKVLNKYHPQVIINAAAYTAVDKAEDAGERDFAFAINAQAPALMARYIANVSHGILVHYSTDYVFADTLKTPYSETDVTGPFNRLCVYGQSKLAGEQAIEEIFNLANDSSRATFQNKFSRYFILRTSWVYGNGNNFIRTILKLATEQDQLKVVADQVGVPTSAQWLAEVGIEIAGSRVNSGVYHAVPDGETSWYGLAIFAIQTAAGYGDGIGIKSKNIIPIPAIEYPVQAQRPYNSRLSNEKLKKGFSGMAFTRQYPCWREQVKRYVEEYVERSLKN